ncbi:hypothetical protein PENTCL1PPCAC_8499, partial [Pristionchus entomophagus]
HSNEAIAMDEQFLELTKEEPLPETTYILQADNGTIFHYKSSPFSASLCVHYNGSLVQHKLPIIPVAVGVIGGSIYFCGGNNLTGKKIYRVGFSSSSGVFIQEKVRDMVEGEKPINGCFTSRIHNGRLFVSRMDNPNRGVLVDISVSNLELKGIHKGKAIFMHILKEPIRPSVIMQGNAIILQCYGGKKSFINKLGKELNKRELHGSPVYARDHLRYVYLSNGDSLFTVNTEQGNMLYPLHFKDVSQFHLGGIFNGQFTGRGKCDASDQYFKLSAHLPMGYIVEAIPTSPGPSTMTRSETGANAVRTNQVSREARLRQLDNSNEEQGRLAQSLSMLQVRVPQNNIQQNNTVVLSRRFASKFLIDYEVKKIRGEGGFGCVFEAVNKIDYGIYAVKRVAVDARNIEKALVEVRAMAKLDHPGIVGYKDTWIEQPPEGWQHGADAEMLKKLNSQRRYLMKFRDDSIFIYIKMQLCSYSLSDWLEINQQPSARNPITMKNWFKQMVSAVEYVHMNEIIHRDLKPSNVLFANVDHLKLCDFGIATTKRDDDDNTTVTRTLIGTIPYMSPEQRFHKPYGYPTDVFTLGLILAELCVVMTPDERKLIFDNYRLGRQCGRIEDRKTAEFIASLTREEPSSRPTCREMLDSLFLN